MEERKQLTAPIGARMILIGVLALQGAFVEHEASLRATGLSISIRQVRRVGDLQGLHGLIIPGGESTTMRRLAKVRDDNGVSLLDALREWTRQGKPTMVHTYI